MGKTIRLSAELLREANIPRRFWEFGVEDFYGPPAALETARRYVKRFEQARDRGTGLYLHGPPESGKTFLGTLVLRCLMAEGFNVAYVTLHELAQQYLNKDGVGRTLRQRYGADLDCVFLDVVLGDTNKAEQNAFRRFVEIRSDGGYPYLIGSPHQLVEMESSYGLKLARSLHGDLIVVACAAEESGFIRESEIEKRKLEILED